jgi:hypothetical protein
MPTHESVTPHLCRLAPGAAVVEVSGHGGTEAGYPALTAVISVVAVVLVPRWIGRRPPWTPEDRW